MKHRGEVLREWRLPAAAVATWAEGGDEESCPAPANGEPCPQGWAVDGLPLYGGAAAEDGVPGAATHLPRLVREAQTDGKPPDLLGAYAAVAWDGQTVALGRDPLGIKPLYWAQEGPRWWFASEIKALRSLRVTVHPFPPGAWWLSGQGFLTAEDGNGTARAARSVRELERRLSRALTEAVGDGLRQEAGVLLSGGVDSSVVAALGRENQPDLQTFTAGTEGSPDLEFAQQAAQVIGTRHREIVVTMAEVERALPSIIYALESFDAYLVRGATANYFASRLAAEHVDGVLVGEGADELFAGYSYLQKLAGPAEVEQELTVLQESLHNTGLQRVDRINARHGLSPHLPFLHPEVVALAAVCPLEHKLPAEGEPKAILRAVAAQVLPEQIAQRPKSKFAAGSGLAERMRETFSARVSDEEFARGRILPDGSELISKEEHYYYRVFCEFFTPERVLGCVGRTRGVSN